MPDRNSPLAHKFFLVLKNTTVALTILLLLAGLALVVIQT